MKKRSIILISVFVITLLLDQFSKILVENTMHINESIEVINNFFYITYVHNTGAAFSILEGKMIFFYIISIVALVLLVSYYRNLREDQFLSKIGIVLMISGTIGNFIDRLLFQYVRDFLDFIIFGFDFAIFNIADMCLVLGIIIVLLDEFMNEFGVTIWNKRLK